MKNFSLKLFTLSALFGALMLVCLTPRSHANSERRVYLVDQVEVGSIDQFEVLQLAIDGVCAHLNPQLNPQVNPLEIAVVEIRRKLPVLLDSMVQLTCRVRFEKGSGSLPDFRASTGVTFDAPQGIVLSGLTVTAPTITIQSGDSLELTGNSLVGNVIAKVSDRASSAVVINNKITRFNLVVSALGLNQVTLVGSRPLGTSAVDAGSELTLSGETLNGNAEVVDNQYFDKIGVKARISGDLNLKFDANLATQIDLSVCGNFETTFNAKTNTATGSLKADFGTPKLTLNSLTGRYGEMALSLSRCAGFTGEKMRLISKIEDVLSQGRLSISSAANLPVDLTIDLKDIVTKKDATISIQYESPLPCLNLTADHMVTSGAFFYRVECSAKTKINGAEVGGDIEADLNGKLQEMLQSDLRVAGSAYFRSNAVGGSFKYDGKKIHAAGDISLRPLVGVPVQIRIDASQSISTSERQAAFIIEPDELDLAARARARRHSFEFASLPGEPLGSLLSRSMSFWSRLPSFKDEVSNVVIDGLVLDGPTAHASVMRIHGNVQISNLDLNARAPTMMTPGGVWIDDVSGNVELKNVSSRVSCFSCRPLLLNRVEGAVSVTGGIFKNTEGSVLDSDSSVIKLENVALVGPSLGSGKMPTLLFAGGGEGPARRRLELIGGSFDGGLLLSGAVIAKIQGVQFSPSASVSDGASVSGGSEIGGLPYDPIKSNSGLSQERLSSILDWDGNGCRDYPSEMNVRDEGGLCREDGWAPPVW